MLIYMNSTFFRVLTGTCVTFDHELHFRYCFHSANILLGYIWASRESMLYLGDHLEFRKWEAGGEDEPWFRENQFPTLSNLEVLGLPLLEILASTVSGDEDLWEC